jgi:murein DD-endopeptidase MepM/ murein hydrolase activator NlpD
MMFKTYKRLPHKGHSYIQKGLIIANIFIIGLALSLALPLNGASNKYILGEEQTLPSEAILDGGEEVAENTPTKKFTISIHTVQKGETLSGIAEEYGISINTIRWANELSPRATIKEGQKLTILPVTGIEYKVGKGDSLISIAKQYGSDVEEIKEVNDLENEKIKIGQVLIVPNAIPLEKKVTASASKEVKKVVSPTPTATLNPQPSVEKKTNETAVAPALPTLVDDVVQSEQKEETKTDAVIFPDSANNGAVPPVTVSGVKTDNYFIHPVPGSVLTQGRHGFNAVDFGAPRGTPILAAADGIVIVEKGAGKWYGGYGNYIVIAHDNGTQTLYSHNLKNLVSVGDVVKQGQQIGFVGSTGRSTGPHLHFEVRGGTNPWVGVPKGTTF